MPTALSVSEVRATHRAAKEARYDLEFVADMLGVPAQRCFEQFRIPGCLDPERYRHLSARDLVRRIDEADAARREAARERIQQLNMALPHHLADAL